jgi:hypothetical protein
VAKTIPPFSKVDFLGRLGREFQAWLAKFLPF